MHPANDNPESERALERIREDNVRRRAVKPGSPAGLGDADRGVQGEARDDHRTTDNDESKAGGS